MRIATLIVGLLLGLLLTIQSILFIGLSGEVETDPNAGAGAAGFLMALMWLVACALVISFPLVSTVIFAISALIGLFAASGDFADLPYFGGIAIGLAVMAFFGWRGKRRDDEERDEEKYRQHQLYQSIAQNQQGASSTKLCRHCGSKNSSNVKFCGECGKSVTTAGFGLG